MQPVSMTVSGEVAIVTIDHPPVNALSPGVPEGIRDAIRAANSHPEVKAIVVIGAGKSFVAGADIREFAKIAAGERPPLNLGEILLEIEDSVKPVVMAIHGSALGGGLELAMAGHYRLLAQSAKVGQPEVNLGLIPGAAGTQRLPRLAGFARAVEMCAFGQPITAPEALECGLADRITDKDLLADAIAFVRATAGTPIRKTRDRSEKLADYNPFVFESARERARKTLRGRNAPLAAIDAVEAAARLPFDEGCRFEAKLFEECLRSIESRALIHVFFGEREVAKIPGIAKDAAILPIARAAVIGAGTMGSGIATTYANAGIPVILTDSSHEAVERGMAAIRKNYASSVGKGRLSPDEMNARLALISPQHTLDGFEHADIITEAVFEQMDVKKKVFAEIGKIAKPECILASNTSTLDLDEIAAATGRPQMVVGHHYFNPAPVMRLLEVVRGKATSDSVLATTMALAKRLKKIAVVSGNAYGFIGNRILHPYLREAQFLVEEGAAVEDVDAALYEFGMPMGPFALCDLIGIDVEWHIHQGARRHAVPGVREPLGISLLYERGRLGQKNGLGWLKYVDGRQPAPDPDVAKMVQDAARRAGIGQRVISRDEMVDRCILALINEGAKVLGEGIAYRAVDIDVVYTSGFGFPSWRGGPMFYADTVGLRNVLARLEEFQRRHDPQLWAPAPLLVKLVTQNETFADLDTVGTPVPGHD